MPDQDLVCEVRTEGGTYRDWLSVNISQSFADKNLFVNFRLVCAEPSALKNFRLKPKDRVDISLAGFVVMKQGYIVNRQTAYDANRHAVQVDGYANPGQLTKTSINGGTGQYRGYKLDAIANSVLKPYGIKFRMKGPPDGAMEKFPNVMVRYGESPFSLISRLCNQRGMWLISDKEGDVVAVGGRDGSEGAGVTFVEGQNILAANCSIEMPSVALVIAGAQTTGSDSLFGKESSEIQAKATMNGPEGQAKKILAEMPLSKKETQLRANMEVQSIEASLIRVSITYAGWLKPGGGLWELDKIIPVTVKSPMLFPIEGGELSDLVPWSVSYNQDSQNGTTTTIELANRNALAKLTGRDSRGSTFGDTESTPAESEKAT